MARSLLEGSDAEWVRLSIQDRAEERVLWNVHAGLEKHLVETFHPDYMAKVSAARDRLRDPAPWSDWK